MSPVDIEGARGGTLGLRDDGPNRRTIVIDITHCVGTRRRRFLFGGVATALCLETLESVLRLPLRIISLQFVAPTMLGSELALEVTRSNGRGTVQAGIEGKVEGITVLNGFGALDRRAEEFSQCCAAAMPDAPPPADCPVLLAHAEADQDAHSRLEIRHVKGRFGIFSKEEQTVDGKVQVWMRASSGSLTSAHLAMAADFLPSTSGNATGRRAGGSSLDNTLRLMGPVETEWVLVEYAIRDINRGVAHGTVEIWDQSRRLAALGSQTFVLRFL